VRPVPRPARAWRRARPSVDAHPPQPRASWWTSLAPRWVCLAPGAEQGGRGKVVAP
jgi:hypothetical protein